MIKFYKVGLIFLLFFFIFFNFSLVCANDNINNAISVDNELAENNQTLTVENYPERITLEEKTDSVIVSDNHIFYKNSNYSFNVSFALNYYANGENGGKAFISTSYDFFMTCVS